MSIVDEQTHAKYKKLVAESYSMSSLKGFEPDVDEMIARWLDVFGRFALSGEVMNVSLWAHYCLCFSLYLSLG